jgi:phage terminase large subunit-like protein
VVAVDKPERPIGKLERLCIERMEREHELARQGHPRGFWYDAEAGDYAVRWIEKYCRHHKGKWKGRRLLLEEHQKWKIRNQFGWKRQDGTRRFRKVWEEEPRKNGKTELAAGRGVFLMVGDDEPGAEVYTTATAKEQAEICHKAAREMVIQSPELNQFVTVPKKLQGNLVCERLGSKMQILSSDFGTLEGLSPHGDIRDEVHAWTNHELAGVLNTAMGSRSQPLTLEVTTAGIYDKDGVGWQHHDYAVSILEDPEFVDDRQFVYITASDEGDDPFDPSTWWKANPNLGISLYPDFIAEQANEAKRNPRLLNDFLRYHLNQWVNVVKRWFNMDRWRACPTKIDVAALTGLRCYGGLDLSRTTDLTAFVNVFIFPNGDIALLPRFWLPQEKLDEEFKQKGQSKYKAWVDAGLITPTPGATVDYGFVKRQIKEDNARFKHSEIGFDPYNANQTTTELLSEGLPMVEVRQGPVTLSAACKHFEGLILNRRVHNNSPVMSWCVGNAVSRSDANDNIAPDKARAKDKIDGVSATVTALSRYVVSKPPNEGGYLSRRGLVVLG